jgi:hypothetical protein
MHNQPSSSDPSRLGTVEDVNGSSISVKLSENTPGGLMFVNGEAYRVGQVGGFVRIPSGYVDLFGIISQVGAGAAPGPPELAPQLGNRWLRVELVGEGRRGIKFERGISQVESRNIRLSAIWSMWQLNPISKPYTRRVMRMDM